MASLGCRVDILLTDSMSESFYRLIKDEERLVYAKYAPNLRKSSFVLNTPNRIPVSHPVPGAEVAEAAVVDVSVVC